MFKAISFLIKFCWKADKRYVIELFCAKLINAVVPLVVIIFPRYIVDELLGQQRLDYLLLWAGLMVAITLTASVLTNFLNFDAAYHRGYCYDKFQLEFTGKMVTADLEKLEDPEYQDIRKKAEKFLYGDGWGFGTVLDRAAGIVGHIATFIGIIAILATLEPLMILLFVGLVLLSSLVESKTKKKSIELDMERTSVERRTMYYNNILTDYNYGKEIRNYRLGDWLIGNYRKDLARSREFYKKSFQYYEKSGSFSALMTFVQQGVTYAYLIFRVLAGSIGIGQFTMYVSAIATFSSSMKDIMSSIVDIRRFGVYYDAVENFLNLPCQLREGKQEALPAAGSYVIEFRHVSYRYRAKETDALTDISFVLHPGEKIAIVGENGAGKTTLIKLLLRLYDPTEGEILLNNVNIKDIDYDEYMTLFTSVFQDFKLFSFNIRENITFTREDASGAARIEQIIAKMGLKDFVYSLPKGLETPLHKDFDESGVEMSGGEAQKLALCRALYNTSPFVILDEPTAALDPKAEDNLLTLFDEIVRHKTAIYISHRLSSTLFCDRILVFDHGSLIEDGTHTALMSRGGKYAELFQLQARHYIDAAQ